MLFSGKSKYIFISIHQKAYFGITRKTQNEDKLSNRMKMERQRMAQLTLPLQGREAFEFEKKKKKTHL